LNTYTSCLLGNDTAEEDIDIVGGNDPPISSYPPVKIEKEAAHKNSKCSSRSSSNSETGSSSSGKCFVNLFIVTSFSLGICLYIYFSNIWSTHKQFCCLSILDF
jgi:hypothetical protein